MVQVGILVEELECYKDSSVLGGHQLSGRMKMSCRFVHGNGSTV